jgi:predicted N-acetyltransferase YhbS
MTDPVTASYRQELTGGLVLRTAASERDVERAAKFIGTIHGPETAAMTRSLFLHHPSTHREDLIFVEDERSDQIVSSLCLIPWTWRYEDVTISSGEMGIVGTLEDYRRRGLIRAQVALFKRRLAERGCLTSHIQGIPYYYRQFGYEYAMPLEGGLRIEFRHVPVPPDPPSTFRQATPDDIPTLTRLYDEAASDLAIRTVRGEPIWRYLLTYAVDTETAVEFWLVLNGDGQVVGYMGIPKHHFGEELVACEVSRMGFDTALAALNHLKTLGQEREKPGIRLNLPANSTLMRVARSLEDRELGTYAWQIHVPDVAALLRALAPVLERRIAASPFAGLTHEVRISSYRETVALRFRAGRLAEVANLGFTQGEEIRFPMLTFTPLVLGYRTVEELHEAYPDVGVAPASRLLVDTLFPKVNSFIYTIY